MKIEVVTRNVKRDRLVREFIRSRVGFSLKRFEHRVRQVTVRLKDEAVGSELFYGVCQIDVELHPKGRIHVSGNGESAFDSVLQTIRKMEHAITHDVDRHRQSSRIRHEKSKRRVLVSLEEASQPVGDVNR